MKNTNSTRFETETSKLISLFENGKFEEAKNSANQMINGGHKKTLICHSLYEPFATLKKTDMGKAKKAAYIFEAYQFSCWLPQNQRQ